MVTSPSAAFESVISRTSHDCATVRIHDPLKEIACPV